MAIQSKNCDIWSLFSNSRNTTARRALLYGLADLLKTYEILCGIRHGGLHNCIGTKVW